MWTRRLSELALAGWLGLLASDARADPASPAVDDSLAAYRERFKRGMDLYEHGAAAEAIACWEPIYRDLGEERGYRLAYDLGVAYAALDDAAHSGERLQAFVNEVDSRRGRGEALGVAVTKEESDARARLARLATTLGRIQVASGSSPSVARVDAGDPHAAGFIAWVTPGPHEITFDPGTHHERTIPIDVAAGAIVELVPPPTPAVPEPRASAPPASAAPASAAAPSASTGPSPSAPRSDRPALSVDAPPPRPAPFPPSLIAISGGATLAVAAAAVALELHANTLHDRYVAEQAHSADGTIPDRGSRVVRDGPHVGLRDRRERRRPRRGDRGDRRLVSPRPGARRERAGSPRDGGRAPGIRGIARRLLLNRAAFACQTAVLSMPCLRR